MIMHFRTLKLCCVVVALGIFVGCQNQRSDTATVSGVVTFQDEPIPTGTITFYSADGSTSGGGGSIENGAYSVEVPIGENAAKIVTIVGNKSAGTVQSDSMGTGEETFEVVEQITPDIYKFQKKSPLKADVSGPRTDLNFDL